jgi:phosphocarrier protein
MYIRTATITNPVGLHARPATFLIQKANEFNSSVWLEKDERRINAKSLLGVLSLGVAKGEDIRIIGDGSDETAAVDTLYDLITSEFLSDSAE